MLLGVRILKDVQNVNSFEKTPVAEFTAGDTNTVYFQLVDETQKARYMPLQGATLYCSVENIDANKQITRFAAQPFQADDRSIWALQFLPTDKIQGTCNLRVVLTEGTIIHNGIAKCVFRIHPNRTLDIAGAGYNIDPPNQF